MKNLDIISDFFRVLTEKDIVLPILNSSQLQEGESDNNAWDWMEGCEPDPNHPGDIICDDTLPEGEQGQIKIPSIFYGRDIDLTFKWGYLDYPTLPAETDETIHYRVPFTTTCFTAGTTRKILPNAGVENNDGGSHLVEATTTSITVNLARYTKDNDFIRGFTWYAIGY